MISVDINCIINEGSHLQEPDWAIAPPNTPLTVANGHDNRLKRDGLPLEIVVYQFRSRSMLLL